MKISKFSISVIILILALGYSFHSKYINEFPTYIHAWTQADRYAIALGFGNNDLNFFQPETYSFLKNSPDPDGWKIAMDQSITSVDFPIHDFIPGLIMKIFGNKSPWIFRGYILLYSFLGLFVLSKLAFLWTKDESKAILITVFAATSPVFIYYQSGFLPTVPCIANAIIGLYFYSKYLHNQSNKDFFIGMAFLTLAGLSRTPFVIPLIAILSVEVLRFIAKKNDLKGKLIPMAGSIGLIAAYYLYNSYLTNTYGSVFLSSILPAANFDHAIEIIKAVNERWLPEYFSKFHYVLYLLIGIGAVVALFMKKIKLEKEKQTLLAVLAITLIGNVAFSILMMQQFVSHDYYFLDTFYFPIIILLIFLLSLIPAPPEKWGKYVSVAVLVAFIYPTLSKGMDKQENRRASYWDDRTLGTTNNFEGSEAFLNSLNIAADAKILVMDSYTTSIPFILMNRKGYPLLVTSKENQLKSLEWDFDYVVIQNDYFLTDIYEFYPDIIKRLKKIGDNGKISVCVLEEDNNDFDDQKLGDFVEFSKPRFETTVTYDEIPDEAWRGVKYTSDYHYSGDSAGVLKTKYEYGITFKSNNLDALTKDSTKLYFEGQFYQEGINDIKLVIAIKEDGKKAYYMTKNFKNILKKEAEWEHVDLIFELPQVKSNNYEFALYLWNTSKSKMYIDDFGFEIF
ncbi:MAG: glycosyltransferase family 39 protein [Flavobacteriales bacterium]|nr:glycosyltransferase family 39 protein [Flavobacteriales bacterium]